MFKKKKRLSFIIFLFLFLVGVFQIDVYADSNDMRDMSTMEISQDMGIGWNLYNTLEATGDWINGKAISDYEKAWGNSLTSKEMLNGVAEMGFKSVRIPVAWSNMMLDDYEINSQLMDRVEEVVNFVLNNDMYAVVNIHWDGGWIHNASNDYDGTLEKYLAIWEQVAERFKDYPDYLIFESMNEEGVFDDVWNRYTGSGDKSEAYNILNSLNQEFVDLVRSSGENNHQRHLLIAGYATDIDLTIDSAFRMPEDPMNKLAVKVHYYTPSTFTILTEDADWGKVQKYWGSDAEIERVSEDMKKMRINFIDKGVPVVLGEFGADSTNKDIDSVNLYLLTVAETALEMGITPMLWGAYNRRTDSFNNSDLEEGFRELFEKRF